MALVVFTGGARSGKSAAAQALALQRHGAGTPVTVAVFGHAASGSDAEYATRIERHQADRPAEFETLEYAGGLTWLDGRADGLLLVDCLGTLLGRIMEDEWPPVFDDETRGAAKAEGALGQADAAELPDGFAQACVLRMDEVIAALLERSGDAIVVTNEVGAGVVPAYASGRFFADLLGRANRRLVESADAAYLVVAGRLVSLTALPRGARWPED